MKPVRQKLSLSSLSHSSSIVSVSAPGPKKRPNAVRTPQKENVTLFSDLHDSSPVSTNPFRKSVDPCTKIHKTSVLDDVCTSQGKEKEKEGKMRKIENQERELCVLGKEGERKQRYVLGVNIDVL